MKFGLWLRLWFRDSLRVVSRLSQIQIFESLARVSDSKIEGLARVSSESQTKGIKGIPQLVANLGVAVESKCS